MRKISLSVLALFFQLMGVFAQADTAAYKERKLKVEEINFVSGYYMQDGNNSAVTGGIGTEELTNFANTVELKLVKTDKRGRQHSFSADLGFDHYTSASSDKIDPYSVSSASSSDGRFYPSLTYSRTNEAKTLITGGTLSYSIESDYLSHGIGANIARISKDKNSELDLKLQTYFDFWFVLYPIELRHDYGNGTQKPRNSYSASLSFSRVLSKRLQCALMADVGYQQGLLATKFQRVYFTDHSVRPENLPDHRFKLPLGLRASYFCNNRLIVRLLYRYYTDDWGISGHTINLEPVVKLTPTVSVSPFYRYYDQVAAKYFAPFKAHMVSETFFSSDYDLSAFNSGFYGAGIRWAPEKGVFGIRHFKTLELRYGHYERNTGLHADIVTLSTQFK